MCLAVTVGWTGSDRMKRSVCGSFKSAQHGILMLMDSAVRKRSLVYLSGHTLLPSKGSSFSSESRKEKEREKCVHECPLWKRWLPFVYAPGRRPACYLN